MMTDILPQTTIIHPYKDDINIVLSKLIIHYSWYHLGAIGLVCQFKTVLYSCSILCRSLYCYHGYSTVSQYCHTDIILQKIIIISEDYSMGFSRYHGNFMV